MLLQVARRCEIGRAETALNSILEMLRLNMIFDISSFLSGETAVGATPQLFTVLQE